MARTANDSVATLMSISEVLQDLTLFEELGTKKYSSKLVLYVVRFQWLQRGWSSMLTD